MEESHNYLKRKIDGNLFSNKHLLMSFNKFIQFQYLDYWKKKIGYEITDA